MRHLFFALSSALIAGCGLSREQRATIDSWMLCDECTSGQRSAVSSIGDKAVNALGIRLRYPPVSRYEAMRRKFAESFQPGLGLTEEAYVALMLENYVALYQTRAATSLGDIGTPKARIELQLAIDEASLRGYRPDVLRAIENALVRSSFGIFDGSISDTVVSFGDTVIVKPGASQLWDGNESVVLHGSPFGTQLLTRRWDDPALDDSLAFVAIGHVGSYQLEVLNVGDGQSDVANRTIRIESVRYQAHVDANIAPSVFSQDLPQTHFLALGPPGDRLDHFRFVPPSDTTIHVLARWPGLDDVQLSWRTCVGPALGSAVSGVIVDENQQPLPGVDVTVVGMSVSITTDTAGVFPVISVPAPLVSSNGTIVIRLSRPGFRTQEYTVPVSTNGLQLGMSSANATRATARNLSGFSAPIPGGECRVLQLLAPGGGRSRIIGLRFH